MIKDNNCTSLGIQNQFPQNDQASLAVIGAAFVAGLKAGSQGLDSATATIHQEPVSPTCIHKIPTIPLLLNGKPASPESVKDFDGKPLYYILDEKAMDGDALRVFSDQSKAMKNLLEQNSKASASAEKTVNTAAITLGPGSSPQDIANAIGGAVFLWEHINFGGAQWRFNVGTTDSSGAGPFAGDGNISDFQRVFCFLWWCQNINDRVSSVSNQSQVWAYLRPRKSFVVLHQHINFQGAQLWIPERAAFSDLRQFGWNDVASSLSYALSPA